MHVLRQDPGRATLEQAWRWTEVVRGWFDQEGLDAQDASSGDMERCLAAIAGSPGPVRHEQRVWALRLLIRAAQGVQPATTARPGTASARLRIIPPRSPLGIGSHPYSPGQKNKERRRSLDKPPRHVLAVDRFPRARGNRAVPGRYRRLPARLSASGRCSSGEHGRVARRLVGALADVSRPRGIGKPSTTWRQTVSRHDVSSRANAIRRNLADPRS